MRNFIILVLCPFKANMDGMKDGDHWKCECEIPPLLLLRVGDCLACIREEHSPLHSICIPVTSGSDHLGHAPSTAPKWRYQAWASCHYARWEVDLSRADGSHENVPEVILDLPSGTARIDERPFN
ncbi:hypothetical protein HZ326_10678 [Fusarium oxysporum f. sp. albedinis]|nr:hypothetical protein HZ326_10678 [Fusarium oxysporum f. sp. albedinis]